MPVVTVITSIPPVHSPREADGASFTGIYQDACIDSWQRLGAEIVSVNSRSEFARHPAKDDRYRTAVVEHDGSAVCGKPLVLLDDLIDAALQSGSEKIIFVNSDIFIYRPEDLKVQISGLQPGSALVGRRTNIKSLERNEAIVYKLGFDLFILHRSDVSGLRSGKGLYFGDPWWDYDVFCNLLVCDVEIRRLDPIHTLHLLHTVAFSRERWARLGCGTIGHLFTALQARNGLPDTPSARTVANLITDCYEQIQQSLGSPGGQKMNQLSLGSTETFDDAPLRRFSHGLVHHAEEVLGFESKGLDQFEVHDACGALVEALGTRSTVKV